MNITTSLKTLPLITALGMSLALAPVVSMADKDREHYRDHHNGYEKHKVKKRHGKLARKHHHEHKRGHHHKHRHDNHAHSRRYYDWHGYRPHREEIIVYDYHHEPRRRFIGLDNLRFMIGLHTGNVDLVIRD